jgi:hypothetical protein
MVVFLGSCEIAINAIEEFMNAVSFGIPFTVVQGALPRPQGNVQMGTSSQSGGTIKPGGSFDINVDIGSQPADGVNVSFGGDRYFRFEQPAGTVNRRVTIPVRVASSLKLPVAYPIPCIYQATSSSGGASEQARNEVIACTQGGTCTPGEGDAPPPSGGGGGTSGFNCQSSGYCNGKTLKSCVSLTGTSCFYEVSGRRYNCSGCSCQAAATAAANNECR